MKNLLQYGATAHSNQQLRKRTQEGQSKEIVLSIPAAYYNTQLLLHLRNMQGMCETGASAAHADQKERVNENN